MQLIHYLGFEPSERGFEVWHDLGLSEPRLTGCWRPLRYK